MADHALRLGDGVWRIPTAPFSGTNSFAFVDGDGQVTLVDCGMSFAPPRIVAGLAAVGKHPRDVTRIILTHAHVDHAGGGAKVVAGTGAPAAIHADDAAYAPRVAPGGARPPPSPRPRRGAESSPDSGRSGSSRWRWRRNCTTATTCPAP